MSCQEMKYKRLIYTQTSTDVKVYLDMVRVLTRCHEVDISDVDISDVLEIGL